MIDGDTATVTTHHELAPGQTYYVTVDPGVFPGFAGIGDPQKFYATLRASGVAVAQTRSFADHHVFTAGEAAELIAQADARGLTLVTTEKDRARMTGAPALAMLAARSAILPVRLIVDHEAALRSHLARGGRERQSSA